MYYGKLEAIVLKKTVRWKEGSTIKLSTLLYVTNCNFGIGP